MEYIRPADMEELKSALAEADTPVVPAAGCTDLLVNHRTLSLEPGTLIDLSQIGEMRRIALIGNDLTVGALCTHSEIAENLIVQENMPALSDACKGIGSKQVRNRGTLAGGLANASPGSDVFPVLLALGAFVETLDNGTVKTRPADDLILPDGRSALKDREIITAIRLSTKDCRKSAFCKLGSQRSVTIAKINLAIRLAPSEAFAVLGAVAPKAFRVPEAEKVLCGFSAEDYSDLRKMEELTDALYHIFSDTIARSIPNRASMPYKRTAVRGLASDTIQVLAGRVS